MIINIGTFDRFIRIAIGVLVTCATPVLFPQTGWIDWAGVVLVITGLVGICPVYWILDISTARPTDKDYFGCNRGLACTDVRRGPQGLMGQLFDDITCSIGIGPDETLKPEDQKTGRETEIR